MSGRVPLQDITNRQQTPMYAPCTAMAPFYHCMWSGQIMYAPFVPAPMWQMPACPQQSAVVCGAPEVSGWEGAATRAGQCEPNPVRPPETLQGQEDLRPAQKKKVSAVRQCSVDDMRKGTRLCLEKGISPAQAVKELNRPIVVRTLQRHLLQIRADESLKRSTAEATLAAQLASLEPLDPQQGQILISKGNPTFRDNQYFTEDELLVWEEAFCRYALLGWPLDSGNMASMFNTALQHQGRKDDTGAPLRVSQSFTERFIQRSEQLSMYKSSNIDPQRVNKATAVVRFLVLLA
jgi:hypothetical protein